MLSLPEPSKQRYLEGLDAALGALESHLQAAPPEQELEAIADLARREGWDWRRLPSTGSYRTLAGLVSRVRREYQWFQRRSDAEGLSLDPASGLPWSFSLIELEALQRSGPARLAKLPSLGDLATELRGLLEGDAVDLEDVPRRAWALHETAQRRDFLSQLCEAQLLGWQASAPCSPPLARKLMNLGHEQLWSVALLRYRPEDSLFVAYVVDLWSDAEGALLGDHAGHGGISEELERAFRFGVETPAWFVLQRLDERFPTLHPVHVSRGIIGPYLHNFAAGCDDRELPAIADVLHHEAEIGVLRFTRQYAFAPHRGGRGDERRQQIYRRNWHEEIYACPGRHAARLAQAVLGTQARVVKA